MAGPDAPRTIVSVVIGATLLLVAVLLAGCGENYPRLVGEQHVRVTALVRGLGQSMASGGVRNANLITQYAHIVRQARPDVGAITDELAKEGTTDGLAYASLVKRLRRVNQNPKSEREADASLDELLRVEAATDSQVFNDSLVDVVNVLADMSGGKLARLHVPENAGKSKAGAGSHLVGNPRYGQWRRDSSGGNFWAFYGQYALMRDLFFSPRRHYYRDWYPRRGWSYYGNVGRHYYGTRTDSARWQRGAKRFPNAPRKNYGPLRSQRRLSTYGRSTARKPGSSLRRASTYSSGGRRSSSYSSSARGGGRSSGFRGK